jgi:colanic acid/amylovoran biosynthesis glycosyltransferase
MKQKLAIFTPQIGTLSETFIQRHIQDLLPGNTVVVTQNNDNLHASHWSIQCPTLVLSHLRSSLRTRVSRVIIRKMGWPTLEHALAIKHFLRQHDIRVILGEYLDFSLSWLSLAEELGMPFFAHAHGYDISMRLRESRWQEAYLRYNQASGIITMSQVSRTRLINIGLKPEKVSVIPYGIHVPSEPLRRDNCEIIRCLAIGRMVAKKAPILLLDAFRRAVEVCPNLQLDYVGTGELFSAAHQFVLAFNLSHKVILHKGQPNEQVKELMTRADIFLQHSMIDVETGDEEGLPVAILEAMASALPVISTFHAGIPEAVLDGKTGFLVDEGDSKSMSERILLLSENSELRLQMGVSGWQRAKELFTWEQEKNHLIEILKLAL